MIDDHLSCKLSTVVAKAMPVLNAKHVFIRPHCPWQNGKVERYNRTLQVAWANRQVFLTDAERSNALALWLECYNTRRRHSVIGGLSPISRLASTCQPSTSRGRWRGGEAPADARGEQTTRTTDS